jgi:hypothetical protein
MTQDDINRNDELARTMEQVISPETRKRLSIETMGITSSDPSEQAAGRRAQIILARTQYPDSDAVKYAVAALCGEHAIPECALNGFDLLACGLL